MKKYVYASPIPPEISDKFGFYSDLLKTLLYGRGIANIQEAERFLNPDYDNHVHDPYLLKDMDKAVSRICDAINRNELIAIWSDYDADGIPGAVVINDFFREIGYKNFIIYIPDRHTEGFGLNSEGVKELVKKGVKLLITIDCGIADYREAKEIKDHGIDLIITDHHEPGEIIPEAFAIINPKQVQCVYPEKMLCGSGVIFKLIQALLKSGNFKVREGREKWLLDMVGLATLSDMVPLKGENRVFAHYGLKVLRKSPRLGLMKLLRVLKVDQRNISEDDIGFTITPRINAASRMGVPMDAFKLLSTLDEVEADTYAIHLNKINDDRKGVVASMVKEVKKIMSERLLVGKQNVIVIGNPKWRPSLLGLVANSLMSDHGVPVFLWGREGGDAIKGSCRSPGGIGVLDIMQATTSVFEDYGGHKLSGGFSISFEKVHLLEDELERAYEKVRSKRESSKHEDVITIDRKLSLDEVTWQTYNEIEKLSPFGVGNPKPLFMFEDIQAEEIKFFGKDKNHLEIVFNVKKGRKIKAISFFFDKGKFSKEPKVGEKFKMIASFEKSFFRSYPELRLRVEDVL